MSDEDIDDFDDRFPVNDTRFGVDKPGTSKRDPILNKIELKPSGIIYMSSIPTGMKVDKLRELLTKFGKIGRIFLVPADRGIAKRQKHFKEGWVEFLDKRIAKKVAVLLNNSMVGGKRKDEYRDSLWNLKYLKGFRWVHLTEQIDYEKRVHEQRMRVEITRAKKYASHFASQVDKGRELKALEEKVLKKGGLWDKYCVQMKHKQPVKPQQDVDNTVLNMILS